MAITVVSNLNLLYDAETTTNWTTDDAVTTYTGFQREGTYCIGMQASNGTVYAYKTISSVNLTNCVIYSWLRSGNPTDTANGGFRIILGDGTNIRAYYVGGSDDMGFQVGMWSCFVLDTSNLPSNYEQIAGSAAPDLTAITQVGAQFNYASKAVGNADNVFIDACRYISKDSFALVVKGGNASDPGTWKQIADLDEQTSNAWGIVRELQSGVFGIQGPIQFGDTSAADCFFEDTDTIAIFEDRAVPSGFYRIKTVGNASYTNVFKLGQKSGNAGISGGVLRTSGTISPVKIDASDTSFNTFSFYGLTVLNSGTIQLPSFAEVLTCSFSDCDEIQAGSATIKYTSFINAKDKAILLPLSHNLSNCDFISNPRAIHIDTAGTITLDNVSFSGNSIDIYNTSGGTVVVQCTNGSNPSTSDSPNGGTVEIQNVVYLRVYVKDSDGVEIPNARVAIYKSSDMTQLMNELTDANGKAEETFQYPGSDVDVIIRVRKSSVGDTLLRL